MKKIKDFNEIPNKELATGSKLAGCNESELEKTLEKYKQFEKEGVEVFYWEAKSPNPYFNKEGKRYLVEAAYYKKA